MNQKTASTAVGELRQVRIYAWLVASILVAQSEWFTAQHGLTLAADQVLHSIRLDSVGYVPESAKLATIATGGSQFVVRDVATGMEVLRGRIMPLDTPANAAMESGVVDFSEVRRPGVYRIEIGDGATSPTFRVTDDVYNWPFYTAVRGMYLWRCGTAVSGDFAGHTFGHDACHLGDALLDQVGGPAGEHKDGAGGWHDAGDYNKYTVNAAFTVGMMLAAWEHFRDRLDTLNLDLPESDNTTPDFLDEVRWELEWLLKMQADDGSVHHKLSALQFNGFELPEIEAAPRYFSQSGSAATASFAAVMAQAARAFHPFDAEFASRCLAAAELSYKFLQANPKDQRPQQSAFATGGYDAPDSDDRTWAAAQLGETTGESAYIRDFEHRIVSRDRSQRDALGTVDTDWDWGNVRNLGTFTYLLSERDGRDPAVVNRLREDAIGAADEIVATAARHPYARPLGDRYYWGCNGTVARQAMNLHVAGLLTGDEKYRATMLDALHYLFGRNPYGRSLVTGLGHAPPLHPHDRRSGGDDVETPWPGYLIGGPWPKATDWQDVEEDYRTNEIAINWNGALIYALSAFVEPLSFAESVSREQAASISQPSASKDPN